MAARCLSSLLAYETPKAVVVRSWVVGAVHRAVQLLVLAYFVGWVFLHEKAYQERDTAIESSVVTKVKGAGRSGARVLDAADYVTPAQGGAVVVVVTKRIVTRDQAQGLCAESDARYRCTADSDCRERGGATASGLLTGRCVHYNATLRTCEIRGWCPPEDDAVPAPVMLEAANFTLLVKNSVRFPLFGVERSTAAPAPGCRFHPRRRPLCPVLRLGDVARWARHDFAAMADTGAVVAIKIGWLCDLDRAPERCRPRYSFARLDAAAPGYNFRWARYERGADGTERRTLTKAFGIRFDVLVYGSAGKFSLVPTLVNAVAAFASVGMGSVLCDLILLHALKGAPRYRARKFEEVPEAGPTAPAGGEMLSTDSGTGSLGL